MDGQVVQVARAIADAGGRALVVGGYVRDQLLGLTSKDIDLEVYGLDINRLEEILAHFGEVQTVGRAFGVLMVKGLGFDISLPRTDSKVSPGHQGFEVRWDPGLTFAEAGRRRDLTVNAMGLDPLTDEILDPHGGRADLTAKTLRAVDAEHFSEDPLRGLRVAQFAARFGMHPDPQLLSLCRALDLAELSAERIFGEFDKLLVKGVDPSLGFQFMRDCNLIRFFPELESLIGVPQSQKWHPEGDVWIHTLLTLDVAAELRGQAPDPLVYMFAALCHDLGKPNATQLVDGAPKSHGHDVDGVEPTLSFLRRMRAPKRLTRQAAALVRHHLAPMHLPRNGAGPKAYRRLARKLAADGVTMTTLELLARADVWGRTTTEARERTFEPGDTFLARIRQYGVEHDAIPDVVLGRHLVARGLEPGRRFTRILAACRELQDESGWQDPDRILDAVLNKS